jgi:hypothetical protein
MSTKAPEANKTKLIERLRQISRGAPAPIGFGRVAESTAPAMLLVAVLPRNELGLAQAALRAGVTVIAFRLCGAQTDLLKETGDLDAERQAILDAVKALGDQAVTGVIVGSNGSLDPSKLGALTELGVDFVAAYPHLMSAGFLELTSVGRIAILDHQGGQLARGINDLSIQAVLVRTERPADSPPTMTVLDVAAFRAAADGIHRPLIAFPSWKVAPEDVEILKNAGIEALALVGPSPDADEKTIEDTVRPYAEIVGRLGKPTGRRVALTEPAVILPRVAAPLGGDEGDEPDEDDE